MQKTLAVYTVVMGGDYDLPPTWPQDGVDYICFTDQPDLEPNGWTIRHVMPFLPSDTFRSSREQKIRPHRWLAEYSKSIYIDSSVHLRKGPRDLWDHLIPNEDIVFGGFFHSHRQTVADEFRAVARLKMDFSHRLNDQLDAYRVHHGQALNDKPVWGGILARRHNAPECIDTMEIWFAHVLRYSRRDQLSLPVALSRLHPERRSIISTDNHMTEFHKWPVTSKPKPPGYTVEERQRISRKSIAERLHKFRRSLGKRGLLPSQWMGQAN